MCRWDVEITSPDMSQRIQLGSYKRLIGTAQPLVENCVLLDVVSS